eukprot:Ihof_evm2s98 gene=Ihof_evmTU2s98
MEKTLCVLTGASRGYGRAVAIEFAKVFKNTCFVFVARDVACMQYTAQQVKDISAACTVEVIQGDLGDMSNLPCLLDNILLKCTGSWQRAVLVNNAGTLGDVTKTVRDYTLADIQPFIDVNITSAIALTSRFLKDVTPSAEQAVVVNISSLLAIKAFSHHGLYAVGKAARDMLNMMVSVESPAHVKSLNYAPGPMDTGMQSTLRNELGDPIMKATFGAMHETKRTKTSFKMDSNEIEPNPRLIEYFFIGGVTEHDLCSKDAMSTVSSTLSSASGADNISQHSAMSDTYTPSMLWRYPKENYPDTAVNGGSVMCFCFPQGLKLSQGYKLPAYHSFVMTNEKGARLYGGCMVFYEALNGSVPSDRPCSLGFEGRPPVQVDVLYKPKCIVLLSAWPYITLFRDIAAQIYMLSQGDSLHDLEKYIANICMEVPVPPPGKVEVELTISNAKLFVSRPPVNHFYPLLLDFCLDFMFCKLKVENVVRLFTLALCERRILIFSANYSALHVIAESICALIYPLTWQHVYIPVLPEAMLSFVQAPMPYIIGVHRDHMEDIIRDIGNPADLAYLDLENDVIIEVPGATPDLPPSLKNKLLERLQAVSFIPDRVRTQIGMLGDCDEVFSLVNKGDDHRVGLTYDFVKTRSSNIQWGRENILAPGTVYVPLDIDDPTADPKEKTEAKNQDYVLNIRPRAKSHKEHHLFTERFVTDGYCSACCEFIPSLRSTYACSVCDLRFHKECADVARAGTCGWTFNESLVRVAFLRVFSTLLKTHRHYLPANCDVEFDNEAFLDTLDRGRREIGAILMETQAWSNFVIERIERDPNDFEVLFFNEMIKKKKNRSSSSLFSGPQATPFLTDQSYEVTETYKCLKPKDDIARDKRFDDVNDVLRDTFTVPVDDIFLSPSLVAFLPHKIDQGTIPKAASVEKVTMLKAPAKANKYLRVYAFPDVLRDDLLQPRPVDPLFTAYDFVKLKDHTNSLTRRERIKAGQMKKAYRVFTSLPDDLNQLDEGTRTALLTHAIEWVHQQVKVAALTPHNLLRAHEVDIRTRLETLQQQHLMLMEALDLTQGTNEENELRMVLQNLNVQIVRHQDRLQALGAAYTKENEIVSTVSSPLLSEAANKRLSEDKCPTISSASMRKLASELVHQNTSVDKVTSTSTALSRQQISVSKGLNHPYFGRKSHTIASSSIDSTG